MVWGWVCAAFGSMLSIPQVVRLLRTRTSQGVSLLLWQLLLGVGIGWVSHGLLTGHANMTVPNALSTLFAGLVLVMVQRDRLLPARAVWPLGIAVGTALVLVDRIGSASLFGALVILPLAVGILGQTRDLVRSPDLSGLSPAYILGAFGLQALWWTWGVAVGDASTVICSSVVGVMTLANAVLWARRARGVRAADPDPGVASRRVERTVAA